MQTLQFKPLHQSSHLSQVQCISLCRSRSSTKQKLRAAHHCLHEAILDWRATAPGSHQAAAQLCVTAALQSQRWRPAWQERPPAWQLQRQQELPCRRGPRQRLLHPPWCYWLTAQPAAQDDLHSEAGAQAADLTAPEPQAANRDEQGTRTAVVSCCIQTSDRDIRASCHRFAEIREQQLPCCMQIVALLCTYAGCRGNVRYVRQSRPSAAAQQQCAD